MLCNVVPGAESVGRVEGGFNKQFQWNEPTKE